MADQPIVNQELEEEKLRKEIEFLTTRKEREELEVAHSKLRNTLLEKEVKTTLSEPTEAKIFTFWGVVNPSSVSQTIYQLDMWSRQDPGCDITVIFNSPGGSVIDGLALYDFLRELSSRGHKITTKILGHAASMGGVLLQAGDRRIIGRNALVMIHEVSFGMIGVKISQAEDETEFAKKLWLRLADILAERSTFTRQQILRKSTRKDWWLNADEALEGGFVDEILE